MIVQYYFKNGQNEFYTQAVLKFTKLITEAQQREAVTQGRSLPPIPATV
ncbi:MAG: hypothetical protein LBL62_03785 [Planctomycetaceae bacterium]|nr:hypothetical protein [Planctomycetaceae bacterium]